MSFWAPSQLNDSRISDISFGDEDDDEYSSQFNCSSEENTPSLFLLLFYY